MRFYLRTYGLIMLIILSSTLFSSILLRDIFMRTEQREIAAQLKREADTVSRNLNRKSQQFWLQLIRVANQHEFLDQVTQGRVSLQDMIAEVIMHIQPHGADYILLRQGSESLLHSFSLKRPDVKLRELERTRWHPAVRYQLINGRLYMVGSLGLPAAGDETIDMLIIKEIDQLYCEGLTYGTTSDILLVREEGGAIIGTTPTRSSPFSVLDTLHPGKGSVHAEVYDVSFEGQKYHMAFRPIGQLEDTGGRLHSAVLFRSTTLEQMNLELQARLFLNLLAGALLASVITIFISRMVTRPINTMLSGMGKIEMGNYQVSLPVSRRQNREVQELYDGFNQMASQLADDQVKQKHYINEITQLKEFNEQIIDSLNSGIATVNDSFTVNSHNSPFAEMFGYRKPLIGYSLTSIHADCFSSRVMKRIGEIITGSRESYRQIRRVHNELIIQLSCYSLSQSESGSDQSRCLVVTEDITDKTKLEERMFQTERMNALSVLSAGVAHEINNPLSSILSNVQSLIEDGQDQQVNTGLRYIEQDTRRIAYIIKDLLDFSTPRSMGDLGGDVKQAAEEVGTYISRMDPSRKGELILGWSIPDDLPRVALEQHKLQQVFFNLIQNAVHAVNGSGTLDISACFEADSMSGERRVAARITDSGPGIPEEVLPRIFDPFFTTKKDGTGTGLGLSVVYGLMRRCGGTVSVISSEDNGTAFVLSFPLAADREKE